MELQLYGKNWFILSAVAIICAALLWLATSQESFSTFSYALPIAFAKACASILIGLNMSINIICKDFARIRRELRMTISAFRLVSAKILLIVLLCFIMSAILVAPFFLSDVGIGSFGIFDQRTGHLFLAVFSTMFASALLGLLISTIWYDNPQRAALAIPFVMLFQILFSGFVFEQVRVDLSVVTMSNYSIRVIGSGLRFDSDPFVWETPSRVWDVITAGEITPHLYAINNLSILALFALLSAALCMIILFSIDKRGSDERKKRRAAERSRRAAVRKRKRAVVLRWFKKYLRR